MRTGKLLLTVVAASAVLAAVGAVLDARAGRAASTRGPEGTS